MMKKFSEIIKNLENYKSILEYLPNDHSRRQVLSVYIQQFLKEFIGTAKVLDLGCGEGDSIDLFKSIDPKAIWHGIDIENSPEVKNRTRESGLLQIFDGVNLPYPDNNFNIVYCNQVLEHVRYPDALIAEALRVLKPNGIFVGAVSYLEPYHSYSIFNFTPYGIVRVFVDAGFTIEEIRPGSDVSLVVNRQLLNRSNKLRFLWNRNYIHTIITLLSILTRLGHRERNFLKVQFAGHLIFLARLTSDSSDHEDFTQ